MNLPEFQDLDLSIARARIALSLIAMLSLYVDPSTAGGLFHLTAFALTTLLCHLAYSVGMYFALSRRFPRANLQVLSTSFDLFFATVIAFITEGFTSTPFSIIREAPPGNTSSPGWKIALIVPDQSFRRS